MPENEIEEATEKIETSNYTTLEIRKRTAIENT